MSVLAAQIRAMFRKIPDRRASLAAAAIALAMTASAHADDIGHQEARRLVQEGRILPLTEIVERIGREVPGQVLEVELDEEHGAYVYELKILRPDGKVQEMEIDAASGTIVDIEDDD